PDDVPGHRNPILTIQRALQRHCASSPLLVAVSAMVHEQDSTASKLRLQIIDRCDERAHVAGAIFIARAKIARERVNYDQYWRAMLRCQSVHGLGNLRGAGGIKKLRRAIGHKQRRVRDRYTPSLGPRCKAPR